MSVTPRGMSVQEAYGVFRSGNFRVNRRYQRKLVWTIEEKRALVDSILSGYPIPLILLAFHLQEDGSKKFEILDGMQRLNAIFTFIENGFSDRNEKYFDVSQLARAKQLAETGEITVRTESVELLSAAQCAKLLEYTLAVTEFPATNEEAVNEVFGRINSYGRQLSDQEKRQAGVVTPFANIVRELAADIRGDTTRDTLDLADMPEISIELSPGGLAYGIKAVDTFWCRQGVLRTNQLRDSEDEQMLADLVISILENRPFAFSGKSLDGYYDPDSEKSKSINELVTTYGASALRYEIRSTISILREVIETVDSGNYALRRILHPTSGTNPIKTAFYAVFMAFYELCVRQRKSPSDPRGLVDSLRDLQGTLNISAGQIRTDKREKNVRVAKGLMQDFFIELEPPAIQHGAGAVIAFENSLRRSRIETSRFECKQGLLDLHTERKLNGTLLDKIVATICGVANVGPEAEGAVFIGVADKAEDKKKIEALDGVESRRVGNRFVVGIEREATVLGETIEDYKRRIVAHLSKSKLSEPLKTHVLSKIDSITYKGREVICLWVPAQTDISNVADEVYVREGNDTKKISGVTKLRAVMHAFSAAGSKS